MMTTTMVMKIMIIMMMEKRNDDSFADCNENEDGIKIKQNK